MHPFPHVYRVDARAGSEGRLVLETDGVAPLESSAPAEFDGPGDRWSPEGLLVAAVADCFILTFRAVARAAGIDWSALAVSAEGTLDRQEKITAFTAFQLHATLTVGPGTNAAQAETALQRSEQRCLVSNSLKAPVHLSTRLQEA